MKKAGPEIRAMAVRAVESGQFTVRQIAELTNYTVATVYNWLHASRKENRLTPKPSGHRTPAFSASDEERLRNLLKRQPGITLAGIREHFGKSCSVVTVHNTLKRMGITFKKKHKRE